jgi:hypothetical protein
MVQQSNAGIATPLTVTFDYRNTVLGMPKGSLLIISTHFLEQEDNYVSDEQQINLAANQLSQLSSQSTKRCATNNAADDLDTGTAIRIVKRMRYHDKYKRMLSDPGAFHDKMSFDKVLNTLHQFHLLRPIISKNDQHMSCLANFLGVLQTMGFGPAGVHDLIQMGTTGLFSCHCPVYLSYAWCKHACAFAFDRGNVIHVPNKNALKAK